MGLRAALGAIVLACLFGLLIGVTGSGGAAKPASATGPAATATVTATRTITSTVSEPAATVTAQSTLTNTVRVTVTRTVRATVTLAGQPAAASTSPAEDCTPGYSPCIPPGPDVDCAGGSGDGPRYVQGPVYVTGSDPYGLDRDGDGVGCE